MFIHRYPFHLVTPKTDLIKGAVQSGVAECQSSQISTKKIFCHLWLVWSFNSKNEWKSEFWKSYHWYIFELKAPHQQMVNNVEKPNPNNSSHKFVYLYALRVSSRQPSNPSHLKYHCDQSEMAFFVWIYVRPVQEPPVEVWWGNSWWAGSELFNHSSQHDINQAHPPSDCPFDFSGHISPCLIYVNDQISVLTTTSPFCADTTQICCCFIAKHRRRQLTSTAVSLQCLAGGTSRWGHFPSQKNCCRFLLL